MILLVTASTAANAQYVLELEYAVDTTELEVPEGEDEAAYQRAAVEQATATLRARLEALGRADARVTTTDDLHIVVQLPVSADADDPTGLVSALTPSGQLGFHASHADADEYFTKLARHTGLATSVEPAQLAVPSVERADTIIAEVTSGGVPVELHLDAQDLLVRSRPDASGAVTLYLVDSESPVSADSLADVFAAVDEYTHDPFVSVTLDDSGRQAFCEMTETHTGRRIVIVFDGEALIAPIVQEPICDGRIRIALGSLATAAELEQAVRDLVLHLRSASLPSPLQLIGSTTISTPVRATETTD